MQRLQKNWVKLPSDSLNNLYLFTKLTIKDSVKLIKLTINKEKI